MAKNKVVFGNQTLIDITDTTASTSTVRSGEVFYGADGERYVGEMEAGGVIISDTTDSHGGTIREITTIGDPVMLQEKTVTPSTSTQIVMPDRYGDLVESEITLSGNARFSKTATTSHTWQMISGESYIVIGHGTINAVPVTISDEIVWAPPVSLEFSPIGSSSWPGTAYLESVVLTSTGATITYSASGDNYGSITLNVYEAGGYHGLNQVTVNPIPSQYIVPSGTSTILSNGTYDVGAFASAVVNVAGGGGDGDINALITRTVSVYNNNTITSIGRFAFAGCSALTSVEFPLCTTIGSYAFSSCSQLTSISFPECTQIESYAFHGCSQQLTSISFPKCTHIGGYAFYSCMRLTSISFPECRNIGTYAFLNCISLTSVSFQKCTTIQNGAFSATPLSQISFPVCTAIYSSAFLNCQQLVSAIFPECVSLHGSVFASCSALTTISFPVCKEIGPGAFSRCSLITLADFPSCTSIGSSAFINCSSLTIASFARCTSIGMSAFTYCRSLNSVYIPSCRSIGNGAFYYCSVLSLMNLPSCTYIGTTVFQYCSSLMGLYLTASSLCTLGNGNAFYFTPLSKSVNDVYGSIYVRESLYSSYIAATNWVAYSSRFVSLTDAEIEALPF